MKPVETIINRLRVAMTDARQNESHFESWMILNEAICDAIDALAEQPAQQPVACLVETEQGVMLWPIEDINEAENYCEENEFPVLLYTSPPAQKKSAAWTLLLTGEHHGLVGKAGEKFVGAPEHYERVDVYTSPRRQARSADTWVGLTDEEIHDLQIEHIDDPWANFKAIEAKLKEKNHG